MDGRWFQVGKVEIAMGVSLLPEFSLFNDWNFAVSFFRTSSFGLGQTFEVFLFCLALRDCDSCV